MFKFNCVRDVVANYTEDDRGYCKRVPSYIDIHAYENTIAICSANSGEITMSQMLFNYDLVKIWPAHDSGINMVKYFNEDRHLASCSNDKTVRIWDVQNLQLCAVLHHSSPILTCCIDQDSIITGTVENKVCIWDLNGGLQSPNRYFNIHKGTVTSVDHNNTSILSAGQDGICHLYDHRAQNPSYNSWATTDKHDIVCARFYSAYEILISSSGKDNVVLWDLRMNKIRVGFNGYMASAYPAHFAFSTLHDILFVPTEYGYVNMFEITSGAMIRDMKCHHGKITCIQATDYSLVTGATDRFYKVFLQTPYDPLDNLYDDM